MPKTIALDWDRQQLRYVSAERSRRGRLRVLDAGCIAFDSNQDRNEQLAVALQQVVNDNKARVFVALGAGSIEVARFSVPTATDAELPLFVQNIARQELSISEENPALDFLAGPPAEVGSREINAMWLRDEEFAEIRQTVQATGASLNQVSLRPHGLATELGQTDTLGIAVSIGEGNCDVLVMSHGKPIATRSLRLPTGAAPERISRHCVNELTRTLAGAGETGVTTEPDNLVVLGEGRVATEIATDLTAAFGTNAALKNPFAAVDCERVPADVGSYAGLLGLLKSDTRPPVDFLNPRRPLKPTGRAKPLAIAATILLVLVGAGSYYGWSQFNEIDSENQVLETRLRELNELVKDTRQKREVARALVTWEAARFSWLDELKDITERMPGRSEITIGQLTISQSSRGTSTVTFSGVAKKSDAVARMEQSLRDEHHALRTPGLREQSSGERQTWTFQTTMRVKPRTRKQYETSSRLDSSVAGTRQGAAK